MLLQRLALRAAVGSLRSRFKPDRSRALHRVAASSHVQFEDLMFDNSSLPQNDNRDALAEVVDCLCDAVGVAPHMGVPLDRIAALDDLGVAIPMLADEFGRFQRLLMHVVAANLATGGTASQHAAMTAWAGPASVALAEMAAILGALNHGLAMQM